MVGFVPDCVLKGDSDPDLDGPSLFLNIFFKHNMEARACAFSGTEPVKQYIHAEFHKLYIWCNKYFS